MVPSTFTVMDGVWVKVPTLTAHHQVTEGVSSDRPIFLSNANPDEKSCQPPH